MQNSNFIWNDIYTWTNEQVNEAIDYINSGYSDRDAAEMELNHMTDSDLRTLVNNIGW